jgi:membrane protein required for colicin V production
MLIDIVAVLLLVLAVFKGLRKGLVVAVFSFVALFIGLAAAMKLSTYAASVVESNISVASRWVPFIAFLLVFLLVVFIIHIAARLIEGAVKMAALGWVNRIGGVAFYILIYLFVFSIVLFYASQLKIIKPEAADASVAYRLIRPLAPTMIDAVGTVFPFFKNMFAELLNFFSKTKPGV